jgi:hypothetical protein
MRMLLYNTKETPDKAIAHRALAHMLLLPTRAWPRATITKRCAILITIERRTHWPQ